MTDDKDIKNLLIVDESDHSANLVKEFAVRVVNFAKVGKNGDIIILDNTLAPDDKLKLALVVRLIAHTFDNNIPESVKLKELTKVLSERLEAVGSRLSQIIKNENFARKEKRGEYVAQSFVISKFLTDLEGKKVNPGDRKRRASKGARRRDKAVTGVGKDILELLINNKFFETPKSIKEVCNKLQEETKFHDPKVVDMTIRKTFVDKKRVLKRIPNPEKSKTKWLYVIR